MNTGLLKSIAYFCKAPFKLNGVRAETFNVSLKPIIKKKKTQMPNTPINVKFDRQPKVSSKTPPRAGAAGTQKMTKITRYELYFAKSFPENWSRKIVRHKAEQAPAPMP